MKRIKTALGIMACLAAGAAAAQNSVAAIGLVDMYAGATQFSGAAARTTVVGNGGLTTSWFGFKGSEDLGGGLSAEFMLTGFFRGDTGSMGRFSGDNLFSRDANIALKGSFGKVLLGRGFAPNFLPTVLFNPFGDSFAFSPLVLHADMAGSGAWGGSTNAADTGWSNEIVYTSPTIGGLTANLHYQAGEAASSAGINNIGANLLYFSGPTGLSAYYHDTDVSNPNPTLLANKQKTAFLGASHAFAAFKLYATVQRNRNLSATTGLETSVDRTWSLGLSAPAGVGSVLAGYAVTRRDLAAQGAVAAEQRRRGTATIGYDGSCPGAPTCMRWRWTTRSAATATKPASAWVSGTVIDAVGAG